MMTRRSLLRLASAAIATGPFGATAAADALDPAGLRLLARRRAVEARQRLGADGWRVRDGVWTGTLNGDRQHAVPVHLVGGNTYLFVMALRPVDPLHLFSVLDADGRELAPRSAAGDPGLAALLFEPPTSGRYHLHCAVPQRIDPAEAAIVYLYR